MSEMSSDNIERFFKVRAATMPGIHQLPYRHDGYTWPRGDSYQVIEVVATDADPRVGEFDESTRTLMVGPSLLAKIRANKNLQVFDIASPVTDAERRAAARHGSPR